MVMATEKERAGEGKKEFFVSTVEEEVTDIWSAAKSIQLFFRNEFRLCLPTELMAVKRIFLPLLFLSAANLICNDEGEMSLYTDNGGLIEKSHFSFPVVAIMAVEL